MKPEKSYGLRAYFTHDGEYVVVSHKLVDKLSNLFVFVSAYQFAVLEDRNGFIPTQVSTWRWDPNVDLVSGQPGAMWLPEDAPRFATLEQAVAYIDITQR
jgi:hypothetical protein